MNIDWGVCLPAWSLLLLPRSQVDTVTSFRGGKHRLQTQKKSLVKQNRKEESTTCVSQKDEEGPSPALPQKTVCSVTGYGDSALRAILPFYSCKSCSYMRLPLFILKKERKRKYLGSPQGFRKILNCLTPGF